MLEAGLFQGSKVVAAAGTAVAITTDNEIGIFAVIIQARRTGSKNTGSIFVGNSDVSSTNGMELVPGRELIISAPTLHTGGQSLIMPSTIFIDSTISGDGIVFLYQILAPQNSFA